MNATELSLSKCFTQNTTFRGHVSAFVAGVTAIGIAAAMDIPFAAVETKLQAPISEAASQDWFGYSVAIDGDQLAVAVPLGIGDPLVAGGVDLYRRLPDGNWEFEDRLLQPDPQPYGYFGLSVALDDNTLVVSAQHFGTATEMNQLLLYVYVRTDNGWELEEALEPLPDADIGRASLSLSSDRFVVGMAYEDGVAGIQQGAAYVFQRESGKWRLWQRLIATDPTSYAWFGVAVALTPGQIVITAPRSPNEDNGIGAAYFFELTDGVWSESTRIAPPAEFRNTCGISGTFGSSLALRDEVAVVGHSCARGSGAHVYRRDDGHWGYVTTLISPTGDEDRDFAQKLAMDDRWLYVGELRPLYSIQPNFGTVLIYSQEDWTLRASLESPGGFGTAMSSDGTRLCVGAPETDGPSSLEQGAAHVYEIDDGQWRLTASLHRGDDILSDGDALGRAIAFMDDLLLVGAPNDCGPTGCRQGSVHVYRKERNGWTFQQKLLAPDAQSGDQFGTAVAVAGERVIIGARSANSPNQLHAGAAYVFRREGEEFRIEGKLQPSTVQYGARYGSAVAIDSDHAIIGAPHADFGEDGPFGAAYVYAFIDGDWTLEARLIGSERIPYSSYGLSVGIDNGTALVGAYLQIDNYRGAVFVFTESAGGWTEQTRLTSPDSDSAPWFGLSVAIEQDTIAVGAPRAHAEQKSDSGHVYVFSRQDGAWEFTAPVQSTPAITGGTFGKTLALRGDRLVVGASGEDDGNGAVYLFDRAEDGWRQVFRLIPAVRFERLQHFGESAVAVDGSRVAVGNRYDRNGPVLSGAAYAFNVNCGTDINGDWSIDTTDLITLLTSFGSTDAARETGDLDGDRDVDLEDLVMLLSQLGQTCE